MKEKNKLNKISLIKRMSYLHKFKQKVNGI